MDFLIRLQGWLYGGITSDLKSASDLSSAPWIIAAGFAFGAMHALMPGHGKSVLVSYHAGSKGRLVDGLLTSAVLALTHIGLAVVFVLLGVVVISRSIADAGRAPAFETASAALIFAVGLLLLYRAITRPEQGHPHRDGRSIAIAAGFIPCPLTTSLLFFAIANDRLVLGFAAIGGMLAGVTTTISAFALATIFARERAIAALQSKQVTLRRAVTILEFASAVALIALGLAKLVLRVT